MESGDSSGNLSMGASSRVSLAPKWLGKRVGRFKLLGLLGQGAMGRVFRAEDTLMQRQVALKMLPRAVKRGNANIAADMLIREARAAASIEHPNAVQIYEINEAGDAYYIAMELLEGGSLRDIVKAAGPMDPTRACLLGAEAAEALAYAHSVGVIHRDVKPANLMLNRAGRCKVVDFGLARVEGPSNLTSFLAESVGTPQFVAPELLTGTPASPQSDIYSLAGTVWYLLTGQPPFGAGTSKELLQKHLYAALADLNTLRPDTPTGLADALAKALEKNPSARYASMDQFAKVLRLHTIPVSGSSTRLEVLGSSDSASLSIPRRQVPLPDASASITNDSSNPLQKTSAKVAPQPLAPVVRSRSRITYLWAVITIVTLIGALGVISYISGRQTKTQSSRSAPPAIVSSPAIVNGKPIPSFNLPATQPATISKSTIPNGPKANPYLAQWIADDYEIGSNWLDRRNHLVAEPRNSPSVIEHAFVSHRGILLNGRDQYFVYQPGKSPRLSGRSMTAIVVFKPAPTVNASFPVQNQGLMGDKHRGDVNDWLLAWGGSSGRQLIAGAGNFPPPDPMRLYSKDLDPRQAHVAILKWLFLADDACEAKLVLVVDGFEVARAMKPSALRTSIVPIAIGALSAEGAMPFKGMLAEVRLYNDVISDPRSLTERLLKSYADWSPVFPENPELPGDPSSPERGN